MAPVNDLFKCPLMSLMLELLIICPDCLNSCLFRAIIDVFFVSRFTERKRNKKKKNSIFSQPIPEAYCKLHMEVITMRNSYVKTFVLTNQELHHRYYNLFRTPLTVLFTQFGYSAASLIEWRLMASDEVGRVMDAG